MHSSGEKDFDPYGAERTGIQFHTCEKDTEEQQQPNCYLPLENVISVSTGDLWRKEELKKRSCNDINTSVDEFVNLMNLRQEGQSFH